MPRKYTIVDLEDAQGWWSVATIDPAGRTYAVLISRWAPPGDDSGDHVRAYQLGHFDERWEPQQFLHTVDDLESEIKRQQKDAGPYPVAIPTPMAMILAGCPADKFEYEEEMTP